MVFSSQIKISLIQLIEENPDLVKKLPQSEQELCEYYLIKKLNQKEIATLLGKTQGAVSSRLCRIRKRLQFIKDLSNFDVSKFDEVLSPFFDALEIELLRGMMETTCQSETAQRLNSIFNLNERFSGDGHKYNGMTQVKVRHRFEKCLLRMKTIQHPYYELFLIIKQNLYLLHEVKLPHYDRRVG
jgi:hypothetical protein